MATIYALEVPGHERVPFYSAEQLNTTIMHFLNVLKGLLLPSGPLKTYKPRPLPPRPSIIKQRRNHDELMRMTAQQIRQGAERERWSRGDDKDENDWRHTFQGMTAALGPVTLFFLLFGWVAYQDRKAGGDDGKGGGGGGGWSMAMPEGLLLMLTRSAEEGVFREV